MNIQSLETRRLLAGATLDPTFGENGIAAHQPGVIHELHKLPDGKTLAVGSIFTAVGDADYYLARFNSDGSYDTSFGFGDGYSSFGFNGPGYIEQLTSVAVQNDGKVVVAGYVGESDKQCLLLARFTANGALDQSFDQDGIALFTDTIAPEASDLAIQNDGKFVIVGSEDDGAIVRRFNTDGSPDLAFGTAGQLNLKSITGIPSFATSIILQGNGKILVGGSCSLDNSFDTFLVFRLTTAGKLDSSFGWNGQARIFEFPPYDRQITAMARQNDGTIVAVGEEGSAPALLRISSSGKLIGSIQRFDVLQFGGYEDHFTDVAILPNDRILATGRSDIDSLLVAHANADGSPDTNYAPQGIVVSDPDFFPSSAAVQSDGTVLLGGYFESTAGRNIALGRLTAHRAPLFASLSAGGTLSIVGNDKNNTIAIEHFGNNIRVTRDGASLSFASASVKRLWVETLNGSDSIQNLTSFPSTLQGGDGNDTIVGGTSNDTLVGGAGNDSFDGGAGDDTIAFTDRASVNLQFLDSYRMKLGTSETDRLATAEDLTIVGTAGKDRFTGYRFQGGKLNILGQGGNDYFSVGVDPGSDGGPAVTVFGGAGNDDFHVNEQSHMLCYGDSGDDEWYGEEVIASLFADGGSGFDTQDISSTPSLFDGLTHLVSPNVEKFIGSNAAETIIGTAEANIIVGNGGNDTIEAGAGNDLIYGGAGNDSLLGEAGNDSLFGDSGNDHIEGNSGNDRIDGGSGNDNLFGGTGNDLLIGGSGADLLFGQQGDDLFDSDASDQVIQ